jgi:hypothetical protein
MKDDFNLLTPETKKLFGFFLINSEGNVQPFCEETLCTFEPYRGIDFLMRDTNVMKYETYIVPFCIEGLSKLDWAFYYNQILREVTNVLRTFFTCTSCERILAGKQEKS